MILSADEVDLLERACAKDETTPALVETICSCKSSADLCQVVLDRLLPDAEISAAAFGAGLARGLRRLRSSSDGAASKGRLLLAVGRCVSKALESDLTDTASADLHRGLRQPALLLALADAVRDNRAGSAAQRAAGSALVAFCDTSPALWKELAKEVRSSKALLDGFLKLASTLPSITDHRTQELVFETLYRLWKVWKKQPGGSPALSPSTRVEVKEGLSSITIKDFEAQTRALLASINGSPGDDEDDSSWASPPSSFPVDAVLQATPWLGLGLSEHLGDTAWVDVGGDSISVQVCPRPSLAGTGQGGSSSPSSNAGGGVFVSIPAETVAASGKVLVAARSLQVDVLLSECPALARLARTPPGEPSRSARCTVIIQLEGGPKNFSRFRKAICVLTSAVSQDPKETRKPKLKAAVKHPEVAKDVETDVEQERAEEPDHVVGEPKNGSRTLCSLATSSKYIPASSSKSGKKTRRGRLSDVVGVSPSPSSKNKPRATPQKEKKASASRAGREDACPAAGSGRQPRSARKAALVTPLDAAMPPSAEASASAAAAAPVKHFQSGKNSVTGSGTEVSSAVKAMVRGKDSNPTPSNLGSFRRIAQGNEAALELEETSADGRAASAPPATSDDQTFTDEKEDSWMAPRRHLDLAPKPAAAKKKQRVLPPKPNAVKPQAWNTEWDMSDDDDDVDDDDQPQQEEEEEEGEEGAEEGKGELVEKPTPMFKTRAPTTARATGGAEAETGSDALTGSKRGSSFSSSSVRLAPGDNNVKIGRASLDLSAVQTVSSPPPSSLHLEEGSARRRRSSLDEGPADSGRQEKDAKLLPKHRNGSLQKHRKTAVAAPSRSTDVAVSGGGGGSGSGSGSSRGRPRRRKAESRVTASLSPVASPPSSPSSASDAGEAPWRGGSKTEHEAERYSREDRVKQMFSRADVQRPPRQLPSLLVRAGSSWSLQDDAPAGKNSLFEADDCSEDSWEEQGGAESDEHESEDVEEAASQSVDLSDEELSEWSASGGGGAADPPAGPTTEGRARDRQGAAAAWGRGRAPQAQSQRRQDQSPPGANDHCDEEEGGGGQGDGDHEGDDDDDREEKDWDGEVVGDEEEEYDEDDSLMLAQLYKQLVATSRARDKRSKKRKADNAVEGTRAECKDYVDRTAQAVTNHWRSQADELLEQGRQAEEAVAASREVVRALVLEHSTQWQATKYRHALLVQEHASTLKRLEAQLGSGPSASSSSTSKLEKEWQGEGNALQLKLQKHRESAVARFSTSLASSNKKAKNGPHGGGGGAATSIASLLGHLTMRAK
ncbi:unnamed protein product [Pylaiella littoralis]